MAEVANEPTRLAGSNVPAKLRRKAPPIVQISFVVAIVATLASLIAEGSGEAGLRSAIRSTARLGAVWLAVTFSISSLHKLARANWSKWLLLHRREMGLGFAVVQFVHLGIIGVLATRFTESFFRTTSMTSIWGGLVGYVWIAAMAVTSFDGPRKRIGPRLWRWLHTSGMYLLWGIFVFSYLGRASHQVLYAVFLSVMALALGVRVVAYAVQKLRSLRN